MWLAFGHPVGQVLGSSYVMPGIMLGLADPNTNETWPLPPKNLEPTLIGRNVSWILVQCTVYFLAFLDIL